MSSREVCAVKAAEYVTFESVDALNDAVDTHMTRVALRGRVKEFLRALKRFSCKYIGVSFQRLSRWALLFGVSVRTVQRWVQQLAAAGIIKTIEVFDDRGQQHQNLIVIQPVSAENVTPPEANLSPLQEKSFSKKIFNRITTIPDEFIDSLPFSARKKAFELWIRVLIAYKNTSARGYISLQDRAEELGDIVTEAIRVHNKIGYGEQLGFVYRALENHMTRIVTGKIFKRQIA